MNLSSLVDPRRYAAVDRRIFAEELADFLPQEIYDIHVHLHQPAFGEPTPEEKAESWAAEAPQNLSRDELGPLQQLLFPGRRVQSLVFANPSRWVDIPAANAYVAAAIAAGQADGLLVVRPEWPAEEVGQQLLAGGFLGLKPYPGLAGRRDDDQLKLEAFFPPEQQALADELGLIVMLHLPRPERLRDPRNQAEVRRLVETYPRLRLIIAHIGRAYTMSFAEPGLAALADLPVYWDFAMNLNADVIALALRLIGPARILYGSDLPIALMRGFRRHVGDEYINYTDGNYSWNTPERRLSPAIEAGYTLYLYEELRAFKEAAIRVGLEPPEVAAIMGGNAQRLVKEIKERLAYAADSPSS